MSNSTPYFAQFDVLPVITNKSVFNIMLYRDKDWLHQAYIIDIRSTRDIGKECGVSKTTILRHLKKFNISVRPPQFKGKKLLERTKRKIGDSIKRLGIRPPAAWERIWTKEMREKVSKANSGDKNGRWTGGKQEFVCLNCGKTFQAWRKNRKYCQYSCKAEHMIGERSCHWKNGASFEPYCEKFNNEKREEVRNQYNRTCVISGISALQNRQRLDVDHVDENKMQGCNGVKWRLVPLTMSNHAKMNKSQNHHLLELLLLGNKNAEMNYEF